MKSHIAGAAAMVVFGAASRFGSANVPVKNVKFVSRMPVTAKSAGSKMKGNGSSSKVPLTKVLYEDPV